jgi:NADP-dependent 3-hydroxy acid dehydrogenase YdfG
LTNAKIALITGASRGLGAAMSEALAFNGFHTILVARTVGSLEQLYDNIIKNEGTASILPLDITDETAIKQSCLSIYERWKKIDYWIHTAILAPALSPVDHIDPVELRKSLEVNIISTSMLITNLGPLLKNSSKSKAIFFDDPTVSKKYHTPYCIGKLAQLGLVRKWQDENSDKGLDIIIETPAPMATATRAKFYPGEDKKALSTTRQQASEIVSRIIK